MPLKNIIPAPRIRRVKNTKFVLGHTPNKKVIFPIFLFFFLANVMPVLKIHIFLKKSLFPPQKNCYPCPIKIQPTKRREYGANFLNYVPQGSHIRSRIIIPAPKNYICPKNIPAPRKLSLPQRNYFPCPKKYPCPKEIIPAPKNYYPCPIKNYPCRKKITIPAP